MSDEDVNRREAPQISLYFGFFEQVVAAWFVFPGATKAAEIDITEFEYIQVQIPDGVGECSTGVVVAFDGQDFAAMTFFGCLKNQIVGEVSAADEDVNVAIGEPQSEGFIISDDQQVHRAVS